MGGFNYDEDEIAARDCIQRSMNCTWWLFRGGVLLFLLQVDEGVLLCDQEWENEVVRSSAEGSEIGRYRRERSRKAYIVS